MFRTIAAAALLALAGTASAGPTLIVAGQDGRMVKVDPVTGQVSSFGASCTIAAGAAAIGDRLFVADTFGSITVFDLRTEAAVTGWWFGVEFTDLAADGDDLLASTVDRRILRVDTQTGAVEDEYVHHDDIHALVQDGVETIFGNLSTMVYKGNIANGDVEFLTACGGQVTSAVLDGADRAVLLGTEQGRVYKLNKDDGAYYNIFQLDTAQTALAADGSVFFAADAQGAIRRVDDTTGQVLATFETGVPVGGLVLVDIGCVADFNGDGVLNVFDFLAFQTAYSMEDASADLDGSGTFTPFDYLLFQTAYAEGC